MLEAQLWQFFKDEGITRQEMADKTGLAIGYIYNLLKGFDPLSASAKYKILSAFPETAMFLLNKNKTK